MARFAESVRRFMAGIALFVILSVAVVAGIGAYWYFSPYRGFEAETFVEIEHGTSSRSIAAQLAKQGVVRSQWAFLFVRLMHPSAPLQAGEYRFGSEQTPFQVFDKIRRGEIFYEDLTVPEGSNIFDIAALLRNSGTVKPDDFLKAAADAADVRDLDPHAPSLEGYLFPSTYRVTRRTSAAQLCREMISEFRKQWTLLGGAAANDTHRIVTLASLIEKETALKQERPLVAAVFINRLKVDMPLQCDPTTVYAALLENRYRGVIHRSDLANTNPYNTYTHPGLPPGPITNPGLASLKAARDPAKAGYLYFVAKPEADGSHQFSTTLDEHEKAVLAYRRTAH